MKVGLIKPTFPYEKRVALVPNDIVDFDCELIVENGFGKNLDIEDMGYIKRGCIIKTREEIYSECEIIFNLKLTQPSDYKYLRKGHTIIGWTHPNGSGREFYQKEAINKEIKIIDLDNIFPTVYIGNKKNNIDFIPKNFIWRNSFNAGFASVLHALLTQGIVPDSATKIAILACGSVSQGAFNAISKFNADIRMFYRKTLHEFYENLGEYDIIINGIEVENDDEHIISKQHLKMLKNNVFIIDSAADAGRAIYGTKYTSIGSPIYKEDNIYYYVVNNAPTLIYRKSSLDISYSFAKWIFKNNIDKLIKILK